MSFIKMLSRLANLKYLLLVLSFILVVPFTLLPIISSSHLPIISDALAATYYVDATNGSDANTGLSEVTPWKTIAKVNSSNFNLGGEILFKGHSPTLLRMDPNDQTQNTNVGPAAFVKNKDLTLLTCTGIPDFCCPEHGGFAPGWI